MTIDINDELMRSAKKRAADDSVPLREVVEAARRDYRSGTPKVTGYRLRWTTDKDFHRFPGLAVRNPFTEDGVLETRVKYRVRRAERRA